MVIQVIQEAKKQMDLCPHLLTDCNIGFGKRSNPLTTVTTPVSSARIYMATSQESDTMHH